ncbi:hypothetical protein E2320_000776, partial [Naja naja]
MALPCDVATLVKQFLRSLPEPLIPAELQGPLCQVQQQSQEVRNSLTLLITCLLPPWNCSVLRYFLSFLQENKMDLANLAIIFVPNLFSGEMSSQMGISKAEEQLRSQMAVTQVLISHASEIEPQGSPVLKTSFGSKRKASEEVVTVTELSIKKRQRRTSNWENPMETEQQPETPLE